MCIKSQELRLSSNFYSISVYWLNLILKDIGILKFDVFRAAVEISDMFPRSWWRYIQPAMTPYNAPQIQNSWCEPHHMWSAIKWSSPRHTHQIHSLLTRPQSYLKWGASDPIPCFANSTSGNRLRATIPCSPQIFSPRLSIAYCLSPPVNEW